MLITPGAMLIAAAASAWITYCCFLWWMGHEEQVRPRWGNHDRVGRVPAWTRLACGVGVTPATLNLPMAVVQVSAVVGVGLAVAILAWYTLVLGTAPLQGMRFNTLLLVLLVAPLVPYGLAEIVMLVWGQRGGERGG